MSDKTANRKIQGVNLFGKGQEKDMDIIQRIHSAYPEMTKKQKRDVYKRQGHTSALVR